MLVKRNRLIQRLDAWSPVSVVYLGRPLAAVGVRFTIVVMQ